MTPQVYLEYGNEPWTSSGGNLRTISATTGSQNAAVTLQTSHDEGMTWVDVSRHHVAPGDSNITFSIPPTAGRHVRTVMTNRLPPVPDLRRIREQTNLSETYNQFLRDQVQEEEDRRMYDEIIRSHGISEPLLTTGTITSTHTTPQSLNIAQIEQVRRELERAMGVDAPQHTASPWSTPSQFDWFQPFKSWEKKKAATKPKGPKPPEQLNLFDDI